MADLSCDFCPYNIIREQVVVNSNIMAQNFSINL